jgi:hypothetical protein
MKCMEMLSRLTLVLAFVASGCASSSDGTADLAEVAPTAEVTVQPTPTTMPTTMPAPTSDALIAAALGALEVEGAGALVAWDVLGSRVDDDIVTLTLCGWTGDTVFDSVYSSLWVTRVVDGEVVATELGTSVTEGECLNTELIDTALAFTRAYDEFYRLAAADPAAFDRAMAQAIVTDELLATLSERFESWQRDGLSGRADYLDSALPRSAIAEVLIRRSEDVLEIVSCREMDPGYGVYRGATRVDDGRAGSGGGTHGITRYALVRAETSGWALHSIEERAWGDCFNTGSWLGAVEQWKPGVEWRAI